MRSNAGSSSFTARCCRWMDWNLPISQCMGGGGWGSSSLAPMWQRFRNLALPGASGGVRRACRRWILEDRGWRWVRRAMLAGLGREHRGRVKASPTTLAPTILRPQPVTSTPQRLSLIQRTAARRSWVTTKSPGRPASSSAPYPVRTRIPVPPSSRAGSTSRARSPTK